MSFTLAQLIAGVRNLSPLFEKSRVPDRALGEYLSTYQHTVLQLAQRRDKQFLVARAHILIDATTANLAENVGAGEDGGMPGDVVDGTPVVGTTGAGALVELTTDDTENDDVVILVADRVVNSATSITIVATGAGWTVNQFANRYVVIKAGTGIGQRRKIVSNDATTLTIAAAQAFDPVPSTDSTFDVVAPVTEATGQMGVVTQLPALDSRVAYTVSLDASGQAQIDLTSPLTARFDASIPIAPFIHLMGGTVRFAGDPDYTEPLEIFPYGDRFRASDFNAVYVMGERAFLAGVAEDWVAVASVELMYVPIPPAFTSPTDISVLPDVCAPVLIACGGDYAAQRCLELGLTVDTARYAVRMETALQQFLDTVSARKRGRATVTREVF